MVHTFFPFFNSFLFSLHLLHTFSLFMMSFDFELHWDVLNDVESCKRGEMVTCLDNGDAKAQNTVRCVSVSCHLSFSQALSGIWIEWLALGEMEPGWTTLIAILPVPTGALSDWDALLQPVQRKPPTLEERFGVLHMPGGRLPLVQKDEGVGD